MSVVQGRGTLNKAVVKTGPNRFKATMQANSGVDPLGAFGQFMAHDPIKNIDIKRDETVPADIKNDFPWMKDRVPARTQTYTFKTGKLRQNGDLNRDKITIKENPRNKTDNISYNPPSAAHPQQKVYD